MTKSTGKPTKPYAFRLEIEMMEEFEAIIAKRGISKSHAVHKAIKKYVKKMKARDAAHAAAQET